MTSGCGQWEEVDRRRPLVWGGSGGPDHTNPDGAAARNTDPKCSELSGLITGVSEREGWFVVVFVLPPFQKEVYTLLRETYLKTPDGYEDSNYIIEN